VTLGANPAQHNAAHHANFWAGAVAKVQLILRSCGCGVGGVERNAAHSLVPQTCPVFWHQIIYLLRPLLHHTQLEVNNKPFCGSTIIPSFFIALLKTVK